MIKQDINTLADLPFHSAERFPNRAILRHCRGDALIDTSGRDFLEQVLYTYLYAGASVAFAESPETLARDMVTVRPTLMTAVPRVFERLHAQKVKRGVVEERWRTVIEKLYEEGERPVARLTT